MSETTRNADATMHPEWCSVHGFTKTQRFSQGTESEIVQARALLAAALRPEEDT